MNNSSISTGQICYLVNTVPELADYEYYLRQDSDSYLLSPIRFNLFDCFSDMIAQALTNRVRRILNKDLK